MARSMASITTWVSMNLRRARSALSRSNGAASVLAKASRSSTMRSRAFFSVSSSFAHAGFAFSPATGPDSASAFRRAPIKASVGLLQ